MSSEQSVLRAEQLQRDLDNYSRYHTCNYAGLMMPEIAAHKIKRQEIIIDRDQLILKFVSRHEGAQIKSLEESLSMFYKNEGIKCDMDRYNLKQWVYGMMEDGQLFRVRCGKNNPHGVCVSTQALLNTQPDMKYEA